MVRIGVHTLFLLISLCCVGCLSYSQKLHPMKEALVAGDHDRVHKLIDEASFLSDRSSSRLLYLLEKASVYHAQRQYIEALKAYKQAARLVTELYSKSLTQGVLSMVVNDQSMDYPGEDYEIMAIHTMMALLYLEMDQLDKAAVEARRINTRLRELSRQKLSSQSSDRQKITYETDAFSLYLSGLIFEASDQIDSAIVDYSRALKSYELGYPGCDVPEDLVVSLYRLAQQKNRSQLVSSLRSRYGSRLQHLSQNTAGLVVIAKGYPVIGKEAETFVFSLGDQVIRYEWPVIREGSSPMPPYRIQVGTGSSGESLSQSMDLVQDYDQLSRVMLKQKRLGLTAKAVTRIATKAGVAHSMMRSEDPLVQIFGIVLSLSSLLTETADTRSWNLLPSKMGLKRYALRPGTSYTLAYESVHGRRSSYSFVQDNRLRFVVLDYSQNTLNLTSFSKMADHKP